MTNPRIGIVGAASRALDALVLPNLLLWNDETVRDGLLNMAVDQWLLEQAERPILRVYRWAPDWGSYGYFVKDAEAEAALAGLHRVRRWTGGGIVDHRHDWTYTLIDPAGGGLSQLRGAESYRVIHAALAAALQADGHAVELAGSSDPARGGTCFVKPVEYDLTDTSGTKMAGAGQRRSRHGLLHQGSLISPVSEDFSEKFAWMISRQVKDFVFTPELPDLELIVENRYGSRTWKQRR